MQALLTDVKRMADQIAGLGITHAPPKKPIDKVELHRRRYPRKTEGPQLRISETGRKFINPFGTSVPATTRSLLAIT